MKSEEYRTMGSDKKELDGWKIFLFSVMNEAIFENRDRIRENHFIFWTDSDDSKSSHRMTLIRLFAKDLCRYFERYSTGCNKIIELKKCKANMIFELKQKHNL